MTSMLQVLHAKHDDTTKQSPSVMLPHILAQACMGALAVRLLTFRRWNDEMPYAKPFFMAFGILIAELYIENFFIW